MSKRPDDNLVEALIDDARAAMWHDADINGEAWRYALDVLDRRFRNTLRKHRRAARAALAAASKE